MRDLMGRRIWVEGHWSEKDGERYYIRGHWSTENARVRERHERKVHEEEEGLEESLHRRKRKVTA